MVAMRLRSGNYKPSDNTGNVWKDANPQKWTAKSGCSFIPIRVSWQFDFQLQRFVSEAVAQTNDRYAITFLLNRAVARKHDKKAGRVNVLRQTSLPDLQVVAHHISLERLLEIIHRCRGASHDSD